MKKLINKNLIKIILFGVVLSVASCTDLADTSYTEIIAESFEPSDQDVAAIVASGYDQWRKIVLFWNGVWRSQEVGADEVVIPSRPNGWVDGGIYRRIHEHNFVPDEDTWWQAWNRTYSGIADCNRIIYQIESGFLPLADQADQVLAELKVLRASYYWVLVDMFGNVPIVTDFDVPEGFLPEQSTRKEVYDFIIKELTDNVGKLTPDNNGLTYGRFNEWAGRLLLAKMYLNAEVYSGTAAWSDCIAQCDMIINSGAGYALESDQKNVFVTENQNSKEIVFGIPIDDTYTTDWNSFDIHMQTLQPACQLTYNLSQTPWGGMCAIPQFINSFDPDDSRYTANFIRGQQYASSGDSLKCTLGSIIGQPLAFVNEVPGVDSSQGIHGYRFGKYEIALGSTNILNNDFVLFRYADVLMMKAECLLRTGKSDEAATLVTQVRQRAFSSDPSKATVTGTELEGGSTYDYGRRDHNMTTNEGGDNITYGRFLDELGWEFNQEGRRRPDMIRFGVYTTKSWFSHNSSDSNHQLFPIPKLALDANPKLTQNPGY